MDNLLIRKRQDYAVRLLAIDAGTVVDSYAERNSRTFNPAERAVLIMTVHRAVGEMAQYMAFDTKYPIPTASAVWSILECELSTVLTQANLDEIIGTLFGGDFDARDDADRAVRRVLEAYYQPIFKDMAADLYSAILDATAEPTEDD